jgi:hypothetical protein
VREDNRTAGYFLLVSKGNSAVSLIGFGKANLLAACIFLFYQRHAVYMGVKLGTSCEGNNGTQIGDAAEEGAENG